MVGLGPCFRSARLYSAMRLRVGILGMADNRMTPLVVSEMTRQGRRPEVGFLLRPDARAQWRRVVRKLKGAGIRQTIARVAQALRPRDRGGPAADSSGAGVEGESVISHVVRNFNDAGCRALVTECDLDLLIVLTDTLIGRGTFSIPRIGCLNAHPGWLPAYRGLGSTLAMLRDGFAPAVTVHFIDEGIDTGPVLLRRTIGSKAAGASPDAERLTAEASATALVDAIEMIESGEARLVDTFLEPSNLTRGFPVKLARSFWAKVESEPLTPFPEAGSRAPTSGLDFLGEATERSE
jgi:hypothetical protein